MHLIKKQIFSRINVYFFILALAKCSLMDGSASSLSCGSGYVLEAAQGLLCLLARLSQPYFIITLSK